MSFVIDDTPPPKPNVRAVPTFIGEIRKLEPGKSMLIHDVPLSTVRVTVTRVKKQIPDSSWTVRKVGMGDIRVWRLA